MRITTKINTVDTDCATCWVPIMMNITNTAALNFPNTLTTVRSVLQTEGSPTIPGISKLVVSEWQERATNAPEQRWGGGFTISHTASKMHKTRNFSVIHSDDSATLTFSVCTRAVFYSWRTWDVTCSHKISHATCTDGILRNTEQAATFLAASIHTVLLCTVRPRMHARCTMAVVSSWSHSEKPRDLPKGVSAGLFNADRWRCVY